MQRKRVSEEREDTKNSAGSFLFPCCCSQPHPSQCAPDSVHNRHGLISKALIRFCYSSHQLRSYIIAHPEYVLFAQSPHTAFPHTSAVRLPFPRLFNPFPNTSTLIPPPEWDATCSLFPSGARRQRISSSERIVCWGEGREEVKPLSARLSIDSMMCVHHAHTHTHLMYVCMSISMGKSHGMTYG